MLDTSAWNRLADDDEARTLVLRAIERHEIMIIGTRIQREELGATSERARLKKLLDVLTVVQPTETPVVGFILDESCLDVDALNDDAYQLERLSKGRRNRKDGLISSTGLHHGAVFVTCDSLQAARYRDEGGTTMTFDAFIDSLR